MNVVPLPQDGLQFLKIRLCLLLTILIIATSADETKSWDHLENNVIPGGGGGGSVAPKISHLDVKCGKKYMSVYMSFDGGYFNGIIYSKGGYGHQQCVYVHPGSNSKLVSFDIHYDSCGTHSDLHGKYFENTVIVQYQKDIIEAWDEARKIKCEWHDNYEKVAGKPAIKVADLEVIQQDFMGDKIGCWLEIQTGKGPWAKQVSGMVRIGQRMTMVLAITDEYGQFDMRVKSCFAHDGTRQSRPLYLTDDHGCILRPKLMSPFKKIKVDEGRATVISYAYFSAFKFPDKVDVQIECKVEVCRYGCQDHCPNTNDDEVHPKNVGGADGQTEEPHGIPQTQEVHPEEYGPEEQYERKEEVEVPHEYQPDQLQKPPEQELPDQLAVGVDQDRRDGADSDQHRGPQGQDGHRVVQDYQEQDVPGQYQYLDQPEVAQSPQEHQPNPHPLELQIHPLPQDHRPGPEEHRQQIHQPHPDELGPQGHRPHPDELGPQGHPDQLGPQGHPDQIGSQGHQPHPDELGPQGHQGHPDEFGPQGHQPHPDELGPQGHQSHPDEFGPQGHQPHPDELGPQGHQGHPDEFGSQGHPDELGPQGHQGHPDELGPQGHKDEFGSQGHQGHPDEHGPQGHQRQPDQLGPQGHQRHPDELGPQGHQPHPDQLGPQGHQRHPDELGPQGHLQHEPQLHIRESQKQPEHSHAQQQVQRHRRPNRPPIRPPHRRGPPRRPHHRRGPPQPSPRRPHDRFHRRPLRPQPRFHDDRHPRNDHRRRPQRDFERGPRNRPHQERRPYVPPHNRQEAFHQQSAKDVPHAEPTSNEFSQHLGTVLEEKSRDREPLRLPDQPPAEYERLPETRSVVDDIGNRRDDLGANIERGYILPPKGPRHIRKRAVADNESQQTTLGVSGIFQAISDNDIMDDVSDLFPSSLTERRPEDGGRVDDGSICVPVTGFITCTIILLSLILASLIVTVLMYSKSSSSMHARGADVSAFTGSADEGLCKHVLPPSTFTVFK